MANEYPREAEIEAIAAWDTTTVQQDKKLWAYIKVLWWMPGWGWRETRRRIRLSTGGWSGNEDLIEAMKRNWTFWPAHWVSTRRGGHYVFTKKPFGG